ncbi:MAG: GntR family transcriptional regulator [Gammaproteobacteria bacterium]
MTEEEAPLYRRLADTLRRDIAGGRLRAGDALPTEKRLCEEHAVSRHTAREALRLLTEEGLIERRQGAGSVVAAPPAATFAQPTGDFDTILQYARDATFVLDGAADAAPAELAALGLTGSYRRFDGVRELAGQPPVALASIYVATALAPPDAVIDRLEESVSEWIERHHDTWIERVSQRIEAVALDAADAARLGVEPGSPALGTERRYHDAAGRVVMLSLSRHPAARFAYIIDMRRRR